MNKLAENNCGPTPTFDPNDSSRCTNCGSKYHCVLCLGACGMMGHWVQDNKDSAGFYRCQDPERYEAWLNHQKLERESINKATLYDLIVRYPDYAKEVLDGI